MPRVKRGPKRKNRRVRVLKLAKGYYGTKHNCFRIAELLALRFPKLAALLARNTAALAISCGVPMRPVGFAFIDAL